MAKVKFKGGPEMQKKLGEIAKKFPQNVGRAIFMFGESIMLVSKRDFVPVDLGALRSSGIVETPVIKGTSISVTLSYGGVAAPYALEQHEDLDIVHTVGQAKYLERPLMDAAPNAAQEISSNIKL